MLLIKLLRYFQGYAVFKAYGGFSERFINLCTGKHLPLWNIKNTSGTISAYTASSAVEQVRIQAEKSGLEFEIIKESGLKNSLKKHKKRKGLLISLLVCCAVCVFLSNFIWGIQVSGNEKYTDDEIIAQFEKHSVKIGALKSSVDTRAVSEKVVSELDSLAWAKVNIRGCFAFIEVNERIPKPVVTDQNKATNIVAKTDGQIMRYEVAVGTETVKSGFAVTKGDLLVAGVITSSSGKEKLVHSKAKITAETKHSLKEEFNGKIYSQSGESTKYSVFFFGLDFPKYKDKDEAFLYKSYLENGEKILPAGIYRYTKSEYENEHPLSQNEKNLLSALQFNNREIDIFLNCENVLKSEIKEKDGVYFGEFTCEEDIGEEVDILVSDE